MVSYLFTSKLPVREVVLISVGLHWYTIRLLAPAAATTSGVDWPEAHMGGDARKRWRWARGTVLRDGKRLRGNFWAAQVWAIGVELAQMRNWGALVAAGGRRPAVEGRAVELWRREYGATAGARWCEETESASARRDGAGLVFCIGILFRWGHSGCFLETIRARGDGAQNLSARGTSANPWDLSRWIGSN